MYGRHFLRTPLCIVQSESAQQRKRFALRHTVLESGCRLTAIEQIRHKYDSQGHFQAKVLKPSSVVSLSLGSGVPEHQQWCRSQKRQQWRRPQAAAAGSGSSARLSRQPPPPALPPLLSRAASPPPSSMRRAAMGSRDFREAFNSI